MYHHKEVYKVHPILDCNQASNRFQDDKMGTSAHSPCWNDQDQWRGLLHVRQHEIMNIHNLQEIHGLSDSIFNGLPVLSGQYNEHGSLAFAKAIFLVLVIICCGGAPEQIVGSALGGARIVRITKKYKWKYTRFATSISTTGGARLTWTKTISFIFIKISVGRAPHVSVVTTIGCAFIILLAQKLKIYKTLNTSMIIYLTVNGKWHCSPFALPPYVYNFGSPQKP